MAKESEITELREEFRPPEWLTDTVPRKAPYFPQMGDEVIYFHQGNMQYLKAVQQRRVYEVDLEKGQPWHKIKHLRVLNLAVHSCSSKHQDRSWV